MTSSGRSVNAAPAAQIDNAIPVIAVVGPTASGKTALSLELAQLLGGHQAVEIISADAMQLYRGMDIGTAKLPVEGRRGIAHHQLDVLAVTEEASVAAYQRSARADIEAIFSRGRIPLVVGGSGLYVSGLLDELEFPGHDPAIRADLEHTAEVAGLSPLLTELEVKDPTTYRLIDRQNPRRVIRALEVVRMTGKSYTPVFPRHTSHYARTLTVAIERERDVLNEAIFARAEGMFTGGLLEEVRGLLKIGLREGPTAPKATGYAEAIAVLDGVMTVTEAVEKTAIATRRLAKKQRTWFRPDPRVTWYDLTDGDIAGTAAEIARKVQALSVAPE